MSELLAETHLSEEQRSFVGAIRSSADKLLSIINDILDLSKIEAGKLELSPTAFSLRECIRRPLELLAGRRRAEEYRVVLRRRRDRARPPDWRPSPPATGAGQLIGQRRESN